MFQNSQPEPPADFPEWFDNDESEDGTEQEAFSLK